MIVIREEQHMKELAGEQGDNDGDENIAMVAAEAASAAASEAEAAAAQAEAAAVKLHMNQERSKRTAEEAVKAAAAAAAFQKRLQSSRKSAGSFDESAIYATTAANVKASKEAAAQAQQAAKRARDACKRYDIECLQASDLHPQGSISVRQHAPSHIHPALYIFQSPHPASLAWKGPWMHWATPCDKGKPCRKGLDPADLGFRGPQWIVLITSVLGAVITVALLAVTSNLFSTTQANVARKGFENFQSVDPLKVRLQLDSAKAEATHAPGIAAAHVGIKNYCQQGLWKV